jgi:hypothetical protein
MTQEGTISKNEWPSKSFSRTSGGRWWVCELLRGEEEIRSSIPQIVVVLRSRSLKRHRPSAFAFNFRTASPTTPIVGKASRLTR